MNKTTSILLVLLLLLAGGAYFFFNKSDDSTNSWELALANPLRVHKVTLSHPNGTFLTLSKKGDDWFIEDKPARKEAIDLLLQTLEKMHIRSRVSKAAEGPIFKSFKKSGISVSAFDRNGKEMKSWIIGPQSQGSFGTYIMLKGASTPFDVDIMGWEGALRPRFMLDKTAWRDRTIFGYNHKTITSIDVRYFDEKNENSSFHIEKKDGKYSVFSPKSEEKTLKEAVLPKVLHYLKGYEFVIAENFVNELSSRDSILQTVPFAEIKIETDKGEKKAVKLFPLPSSSERIDSDGNVHKNEIERYHASINDNSDFVLVQQRVIGKLMPPIDYFFTKE